jgi:hypothetical protein
MLELNNMAFMDAIGHNMSMPTAHVDTLHAVSSVCCSVKVDFFSCNHPLCCQGCFHTGACSCSWQSHATVWCKAACA